MISMLVYFGSVYGPVLGCLLLLGLLGIRRVNPRGHQRFRAAFLDGLIGIGLFLAGYAAMSVVARVPFVRSFGLSGSLVGISWCVMYLVFRDAFRFGFNIRRSFGKQLAEVQPVSVRGRPLYLGTAVGRNLTAAPLVLVIVPDLKYLIAGWVLLEIAFAWLTPSGRRLGDRLAGTVVEPRAVATAADFELVDDVMSLSVDQDEEAELVRRALQRAVTGQPSKPMTRTIAVERIAWMRSGNQLEVAIGASGRVPEVGFSLDRSLGLPGFVVRLDGVPEPYPEHEIVVNERELQRIWAIHEAERSRLNVVLLLPDAAVDVVEAVTDDTGVRILLARTAGGRWMRA